MTIPVIKQRNHTVPLSLFGCQFKVNSEFVHANNESKEIDGNDWWKYWGPTGSTCAAVPRKYKSCVEKLALSTRENIFDRKLEPLLELIDNIFTSTTVFHKLTTKMIFKGFIQAIDLANLQTRALCLILSLKN